MDELDFLTYCEVDRQLAIEQIIDKIRGNHWMTIEQAADIVGYDAILLDNSDIEYIKERTARGYGAQ